MTGASEADRYAFVVAVQDVVRELESGAQWENRTLDGYLEALAAWLSDCEGYYQHKGMNVPSNPWEVLIEALQAAKIYE